MASIDLKELLKAGVHFGHNASRWSPKMRPFIWGVHNKTHLIDISKTATLMEQAGNFLRKVAEQNGSILWVGTKKPAQQAILQHAAKTKSPCVIHRWIGGTLSNYDQVKKAMTRLLHLRDVAKKSLESYSKKEQSMFQKELARLERNVGGILELSYPPSVIVIVDAKKERSAIKEALDLSIPVIALVDTNTDPSGIPLIIPSNDDSPHAIAFILSYLSNCIVEGQALYKQAQEEAAVAKKAELNAKKTTSAKKEDATGKNEDVVQQVEEVKEVATEEEPAKKISSKPTPTTKFSPSVKHSGSTPLASTEKVLHAKKK